MRRLVVALIVVALAFSLSGCSSGGSSTPAATTPAPSTGLQAPAVAAKSTGLDNRSINETETFKPFPTGPDIPAELKQKITIDKQPTIVFFFDPTQNASTEVRKLIDSVRSANRGMVDLVAYDIGKYTKADANGAVTVQPALGETTATKQAVLLARDPAVDVTLTPFIVITDSQGYIIFKSRGLIDRAFLEREVQRAAK